MFQTIEIASLSVLIPCRNAENMISREIVPFRIYESADGYKAVPLLSDEERKKVFLPEVISFGLIQDKVTLHGEANDAHMAVVREIVMEMKMQEFLDR